MKNQYILKLVIYCLLLSIVGIATLYVFSVYVEDQVFSEIGKAVSISLITAAFFTIVINFFQRNHFEEKLSDVLEHHVPFMNRLNKVGITSFERSFPLQSDEYETSFIESNTITLVFNDGKRFYQNNITLFRKRFSQSGKTTRFVFMDPKASDSIAVLTRKNGHKGNYYSDKISQFIDYLKEESKAEDHNVEIYVHDLFTTMSVVLTDQYAMFSLYRIAPGQEAVPHITVQKNSFELCEYDKIAKDVQKLVEHSTKA
ncbi:hypothetical protein ACEUKD_08745 [Vibrio diabolicus]|uniref:hypothetical protein n=1 Tax=Vibrio diabolicus TaxID=50719 RepID=UPI0035A97DF6